MNQVRSTGGPWSTVAVCCLFVAISWLWPVLLGPESEMLPNLVAWASAIVLFVLLPLVREQAEQIIFSGWLVAAVMSAVLALLQFFDLENSFSPWVVATRPGYVLANVHQVNVLASLLCVGLLCLRWMVLNRCLKPFQVGLIACLLIFGIAATASRTGLINAILVSLLLLFWGRFSRSSWFAVALGLVAYVVAVFSLPWIQESLGIVSERDLLSRFKENSACSSRLVIWSNVLQLISLKPITGWGWDSLTYAHYITSFEGQRFCEKLSNAHNLPLQIAVSIGIPAAAVLVALISLAVLKLKPWMAQNTSEQLAWGVLLLLGCHSLLEYPLWFGVPQVMAALAGWIIFRARQSPPAQVTSSSATGMTFMTRAVVGILMLSALGYVAWDYFRVSQLFIPSVQRHANYKTDTLNKVKDSWLFQQHVLYAVVNATTVNKHNAQMVLDAALEALEHSPDPEMIVKVIKAAELTGNTQLVELHTDRFKSAWPEDFLDWEAGRSNVRE